MNIKFANCLGVSLSFLLAGASAYPCSAFQWTLDGSATGEAPRPLVAKSYDWITGFAHGYVFTNKRNVEKTAMDLKGVGTPAHWTSKFASLTFNQFGREFPMGGMNEKGLVIEILQLNMTSHIPSTDARPFVNESQWIQLHLDLFETTQDVIDNLDSIRVEQAFAGTHYFVCDATGDCAVIEYLEGAPVVSHGSRDLPIAAITNSSYLESYNFFLKNQGTVVPGPTSLARFLRVAQAIEVSDAESVGDAFALLSRVDQNEAFLKSMWNLVYDPQKGSVQYRTRALQDLRALSTASFNGSCKSAVQVIDMNQAGNPMTIAQTYSPALNTKIVNKNKLPGVTQALLDKAAAYPEASTRCTE